MTHTRYAALAAVASFVGFTATAHAQDKACLLEGSFTVAGSTTHIKDCLQNNGVDPAQFKETCAGLAQATAAVGGPPAKITYLAACPMPAQGTCVGFLGQPMSSSYYKRDAKLLEDSRKGCIAQGGKWK
jgi:hypothetical protein